MRWLTGLRAARWLRTALMLLLALLVAVATFVTFNTLRLTSRQITVAPLPPLELDIDAAAARLSAAIRFRTVSDAADPQASAAEFAGLRNFLQASFPAFHKAAQREVIGGGALLYTWPGSDPKAAPIALLAHQDVVPIAPGTEADWQAPPFAGVIRDGHVWGRGAWDDKASLLAILEAAERLAAEGFVPKQTIYFAFGHDEEVSGERGAAAIAATLAARNVKLDFVLDEGLFILDGVLAGLNRPAALIGVGEKGYASLELKTRAAGGHASLPSRDTAIGMLATAIARLDATPQPRQLRAPVLDMFDVLAPEMSPVNRVVLANLWLFRPLVLANMAASPTTEAGIRTTAAPTTFHAGERDNVLPAYASATVNFRLLPGDSREALLARVRRIIGNDRIALSVLPGASDPPPVTGTASFAYRALNQSIREVFPDVVVAPSLMVATTDSRHYTAVTDKIFRFLPVRATQGDLARFHGTNERVALTNYADMIRFYRRLLQNTAQ
jgi:carboxypeptidase PM20D1